MVHFDCGGNVDVGYDLAVDYEKGVTVEVVSRIVKSSCRAEYLGLLERVVDLDPEIAAVAESISHRLRLMMKVDDYLRNTELGQILCHIPDQWFPKERDRRLGPVDGQRKEPRTKAGRKDHCLHKIRYILTQPMSVLELGTRL